MKREGGFLSRRHSYLAVTEMLTCTLLGTDLR